MKSEEKSNSNYIDRLPSNDEEIQSMQRYSGPLHAKINVLGDLDFERIIKMHSKGWNMKSSKAEIQALIKDFVNIYGLIYREGKTGHSRLIRGTITDEVKNIKSADEIGGALSTTLDEDIAKRFCTDYNNAVIMRIQTIGDLPHCYIEKQKGNNLDNEEEVLILPFSKVRDIQFVSEWEDTKYYNVTLEKGELPELSAETLSDLRKSCIDGYEQFIQQVKQGEDLEAEYERLSTLSPTTLEERKLIIQDKDKILEEYGHIKESISNYKNNFRQMLKGLCKQREIHIDKQRNENRSEEQTIQEEQQTQKMQQAILSRLYARIEELKGITNQDSTFIRQSLLNNVANIIQHIHKYRDISNALGIQTFNSQALEGELNDRVEQIGEELKKKIIANDPNIEFELLGELSKKYGNAKEMLVEFPDFLQGYDENSMLDIKINLNRKMQEMIYRIKVDKLNYERNSALSEKDTFLNKILGRTKLKQAKVRNAETKMNYAAFARECANPQNSEEEMLYEIYECAYQYNGGTLTEEMLQTERAIRSVFGNLPTVQMLQEKALSTLNIQSQGLQLPSKVGRIFSVFSSRKQIEQLNNETQIIKNELQLLVQQPRENSQTQGQVITKNLTNIYSKYNSILNNIYTLVKVEDRQEQLSTNRNIGEKQI